LHQAAHQNVPPVFYPGGIGADISAKMRRSKWACGRVRRTAPCIVTAAALLLAFFSQQALARSHVPLPKPRPAEAPALSEQAPAEAAPSSEEPAPPADAPAAESKPPPLSACRKALTEQIAIAPSIPDIKGQGGCGGEDLVRLEAVVLPDQTRVPVKPAAILRCAMASEIANWIRTDMVPVAAGLGTKLAELDNFDSYECRGRNRVVGAKLSEHGRANAIDLRGLKLSNGQSLSLTDRGVPRGLREQVMGTVCARFSTVLGPGSDWYHEDHVHLDLAPRRGNFKICQWNVWDPLPQVAPLLPAERPEEATPREVAEGVAKPGSVARPAAAPVEASPEAAPAPEAESGEPEATELPPAAKPAATKKRREPRRL
jgi:hypothetical protein